MDRGNGNSREFGLRLSERDLLARWICLVYGYRITRSSRGFLIADSSSTIPLRTNPAEERLVTGNFCTLTASGPISEPFADACDNGRPVTVRSLPYFFN